MDLRQLNQSIFREVYPIPKVDETPSARREQWLILLAPESRPLTTFFWEVLFNKLPFSISSTPELFQRSSQRSGRCALPNGRCADLWE